jgi:hypothetical protein
LGIGEDMTQDEIIEMARQSDLGFLLGDSWLMHDEIERFAKLVAQHEREACAKLADEWAVGWPHPSKVIALDIRARGQA